MNSGMDDIGIILIIAIILFARLGGRLISRYKDIFGSDDEND
jgi:hypothetical protein